MTRQGQLLLTNSKFPNYLRANTIPEFRRNLLSVGQLAQQRNVTFTKTKPFVSPVSSSPPNRKKIGIRNYQTVYQLHDLRGDDVAAPATQERRKNKLISLNQ